MKILQLCNKIPYPPRDGGAIAMLNMAESFAANGHQVTILAMRTTKHDFPVNEIPDALRQKINFMYIDVDTRITLLKLLVNFVFSKQPFNASRFNDRGFSNALITLLQKETFDVIQLEGLYLKSYIDTIRKYHMGILSYRAHNIESEIWQRVASNTRNMFRRFYLNNLAKRLYHYENDMVNRYDLLVPISGNDLERIQKMGNIKPSYLTPTGILNENFKSPGKSSGTKQLFYIGALDWIPNQDALVWFTEQVWIPLSQQKPDLRFHIAGRNAPKWLVQKLMIPGIVYHGEVENAQEFIDNHSFMVVPLFAGSGLRIKIIEAMARSKPVLTTNIGSQGLDVASGQEILIADTAAEWIQAISQLVDDLPRFYKLQKNAYAYARENFSNHLIVKNLSYFYMQHIAS